MPDNKQSSHICLRSKEFGALESKVDTLKNDVKILNKMVLTGNGDPPLTVSVPLLTGAVKDLKTGLSGFVKFQSEQEGYHRGKETIRKRNRWLIGILVTLILGLLGTMVTLMVLKLPAI